MLTSSPHIRNKSDKLMLVYAAFDDDNFPISQSQIVLCYSGFQAKQNK